MKRAPHLDPNCCCAGCSAWRRHQDQITEQCGRCGHALAKCVCADFKQAPTEGP